MARIIPTVGHLKGPEGACPPLPYLTVEQDEADRLVARGIAKLYTGPEVAETPGADTKTPATKSTKGAAAVKEPSVGGGAQAAAPGLNGSNAAAEPATADRLREIADHIELLSPDDFEADGPRKGKPKLDVLGGALGFDVTAEDVDAALALDH